MSPQRPQTFADADLGEMMAAANKARAEELGKMFRKMTAYFASFFTSHGAVAAQH